MAEKFCAVCGAENKEHFTYCKHCGAFLPVVEKFPEEVPAKPREKYCFGDISYDEYARFIGSGAEDLLYDFERLEKGNRFVFCLPALFLGLVFGFYGLAAWFFYRNLKKAGLIMLCLGAFFTLADSLVNYSVTRELFEGIFGLLQSESFNAAAVAQQIVNAFYNYSVSVSSVFSHVGFFASFFVSAVCLKYYKKISAKRILAAKEFCATEGAPPLDFMFKKTGGTDIALAVLPFIAYFVFPIIFMAVAAI